MNAMTCSLLPRSLNQVPLAKRFLWTMSLISPSRRLLCLMKADLIKKASTDLPVFQLMPVSSPLTFTCKELNHTIGAVVVILRFHLSVMDSASGFLLDADQSLLMSANQATTSSATAKCQLMHLSATVAISKSGNGPTRPIAVSGQFGVSPPGGHAWATGGSLSISEHQIFVNNQAIAHYIHITE